MDSRILLIGAMFLFFMTGVTYFTESFAAARPYATGAIMMAWMALAALKEK